MLPEGYPLILEIMGTSIEGADVKKTVSVNMGKPGEAQARLNEAGLMVSGLGDEVRIANVKFGSRARRAGFEQGWKVDAVKVDSDAPSQHWMYIPALAIVGFVFFNQRRRMRTAGMR